MSFDDSLFETKVTENKKHLLSRYLLLHHYWPHHFRVLLFVRSCQSLSQPRFYIGKKTTNIL